jgi:ssDNA-binding Zn-finger/Zn-ribbon topoisomerase 1
MAYDWKLQKKLEKSLPLRRKDLKCPLCKSKMRIKNGKWGIFYGCVNFSQTGCKGVFKCNQETAEINPLDLDPEVREYRELVRESMRSFSCEETRRKFFATLPKHLGLPREQCKLPQLDIAQCKECLLYIDVLNRKTSRFTRILEQAPLA